MLLDWDTFRPGVSLLRWQSVMTGILEPQGAVPHALTLLGGVRFIAWYLRCPFLGECRRVSRHFWDCRTRLGYGPTTGSLDAIWTMLAFAKSPGTKPGDLAGKRFTRPGGPVQFESMFVIDIPPGMYVRWPSLAGKPSGKLLYQVSCNRTWFDVRFHE